MVARFLPGGRTGVGLLAGMTDQPRRGYAGAVVARGLAVGAYLVGAGFVAGHAVDSVWVSIGIALALMVVVSAVAGVRTRRNRTSRSERTGVTPPAAPAPGWRQPVRAPGG